jgi:hypothetical protein
VQSGVLRDLVSINMHLSTSGVFAVVLTAIASSVGGQTVPKGHKYLAPGPGDGGFHGQ